MRADKVYQITSMPFDDDKNEASKACLRTALQCLQASYTCKLIIKFEVILKKQPALSEADMLLNACDIIKLFP